MIMNFDPRMKIIQARVLRRAREARRTHQAARIAVELEEIAL